MMGLQWDEVNPLARMGQARAQCRVCPEEDFRRLLDYERARIDRNGSVFSLLVLALGYPLPHSSFAKRAAGIIAGRVRSTDIIGWHTGNRLAVFLPDTPASGAWKLAQDLDQLLGLHDGASNWVVYNYPAEEYQHAA